MVIRRATTEDAEAMAVLHRASILALCAAHYTEVQLAEWTSLLVPETYRDLLGRRQVLVFADRDELRGLGVGDVEQGFINAVYVHPSSAGVGVGRQLVAALEASLAAAGIVDVQLHATLNAVSFYEALGYTRGAPSTNRLPSGAELPCIVMHRRL